MRPSSASIYQLQSTSQLLPLHARLYASKKSKGNNKKPSKQLEDDDEVYDAPSKAKGAKKGKAKFVQDDDAAMAEADEGVYFKVYELSMDEAVDRLKVGLKSVVGRVGRVSPGKKSISAALERARKHLFRETHLELHSVQTYWTVSRWRMRLGSGVH